jgi:hypothetical protein
MSMRHGLDSLAHKVIDALVTSEIRPPGRWRSRAAQETPMTLIGKVGGGDAGDVALIEQ